jgi:hypothetical protein
MTIEPSAKMDATLEAKTHAILLLRQLCLPRLADRDGLWKGCFTTSDRTRQQYLRRLSPWPLSASTKPAKVFMRNCTTILLNWNGINEQSGRPSRNQLQHIMNTTQAEALGPVDEPVKHLPVELLSDAALILFEVGLMKATLEERNPQLLPDLEQVRVELKSRNITDGIGPDRPTEPRRAG